MILSNPMFFYRPFTVSYFSILGLQTLPGNAALLPSMRPGSNGVALSALGFYARLLPMLPIYVSLRLNVHWSGHRFNGHRLLLSMRG